jgi:NADH:ubiquinone oxidoreductase subunit C
LCGFDRGPEEEPRLEVNYHLFSTTKHHRLRFEGFVE